MKPLILMILHCNISRFNSTLFRDKNVLPKSSFNQAKHQITTSANTLNTLLSAILLNKASLVSANDKIIKEDVRKEIKDVKVTNIIFFRHAESMNNALMENIIKKHGQGVSDSIIKAERKILRQPDCNLSDRGFHQVEYLKQYIIKYKLNHYVEKRETNLNDWILISSPMRRCLLTSKALSEGLKKSVYVNPILYESGGCYTIQPDGSKLTLLGSNAADVELEFKNYKCLPGMENGWYSQHSGKKYSESVEEFNSRIDSVVNWIRNLHDLPIVERNIEDVKFKNVIMVIHGLLLNGILNRLMNCKDCLVTHYNTGHTHVQLITQSNLDFLVVLKYMNRCDHLLPDITQDNLFTGNDTIDDSWLKEYLTQSE
jgi:broad specificity phosphatase PhoE